MGRPFSKTALGKRGLPRCFASSANSAFKSEFEQVGQQVGLHARIVRRDCRRAATGRFWFALQCLAGAAATRATAHAHGESAPRSEWWRAWDFDPATVVTLFVCGALYVAGLRSLRAATARPQKLRREARYFGAAWLVLVVALLSPVHPLSSVLFSVHMTQHELLMVVAAPLIVLGRPAVVILWAFPSAASRGVLARLRTAGMGHVWQWATNPIVASLVHAAALWIWHVPVLFEATLTSDVVHALQHALFLGTALMFWQAVLFGKRRAADYGLAVLYLFLTAMHSGALGALITFAANPWYASYTVTGGAWGLTPLEDQQLGGLIMWIPAGLIYVVAGLLLFAAWLRESDRNGRDNRAAAEEPRTCAPASRS
jgi:putative membrane protein